MTCSKCNNLTSRKAGGFTLVELLIVLGIIIVLIGILMPALIGIFQSSERERIRMELQAIATAVEGYRQDHGDYPRIDPASNGSRTLALALIAPDAAAVDGADGPGFRTRRIGGNAQGRVYGPYLTLDKFVVETTYGELYDRSKRPVLYFPASPARPPIVAPDGLYVADEAATMAASPPKKPFYDAGRNNDPAAGTPYLSLEVLRKRLGDSNANGMIDPGESPAYTGPFVLWSAGPDETYGTDDDVTNIP